jgi:hypothetical protein
MTELWKPILGYEDCYAVSDQGRVKRTANFGSRSKGLLAPRPKKGGYITFHLCKDGIRKDPVAHRLVWEAFNGPVPAGMELNHLNGKTADNRLCNLEVCTKSQNMQHSFRVLGRPPPNNPNYGSKNGCAKLTEGDIPAIIALYRTGKFRQIDIGKMFGVSQRMISLITRREKWQHVDMPPPE